ncbi:MAG: biotin--[acetyl-CoA-carboxylase] ligase [Planctomycetota bacterium]
MHRLLELENYFSSNAYQIGKVIYHYDEVSSTQEIAKEYVEKAVNGMCIIADKQTKGKGRLGRTWHSPQGGLWLSIIIKEIEQPLYLNPILAIACIKMIEQLFQLKAKIYWPNDIYIKDKKVAGILTEGIHCERSIYIAGIGININIDKKYFIDNKLDEATSLYLETGKKENILNVFQDFLIKFNFLYELVQNGALTYIEESYKEYNDLISLWVKVSGQGEEFRGQVVDVDIKNGILVKLKNNIVKNFYPENIESIRRIEFAESL